MHYKNGKAIVVKNDGIEFWYFQSDAKYFDIKPTFYSPLNDSIYYLKYKQQFNLKPNSFPLRPFLYTMAQVVHPAGDQQYLPTLEEFTV